MAHRRQNPTAVFAFFGTHVLIAPCALYFDVHLKTLNEIDGKCNHWQHLHKN
jgi:hypothetical protein